jgi:hypothetical protein
MEPLAILAVVDYWVILVQLVQLVQMAILVVVDY